MAEEKKVIDYRSAGVDVERGYEAVSRMKAHVQSTLSPQVLGGLGSFGGLYSLEGLVGEQPVLVSGTDGVGTKLKLAFLLDKHDTIGIDCVAMCANDVVCQGARPLFFLDYLATGRIEPEKVEHIVAGVAEGCRQAGCSLIGGETAEMPGFYPGGEYDLAGFCVGLADRSRLVTGADVRAGDALVGLASSGAHSNGYSLIRKLVPDAREGLEAPVPELGRSWGEELLTPTRIYVPTVLALLDKLEIHGLSHITGGGFIENIPRMIPDGLRPRIELGSWPVPPVFQLLQRLSGMEDASIYNTFNMGIGMVMAVPADRADDAVKLAEMAGDRAYVIGRVEAGEGGLVLA